VEWAACVPFSLFFFPGYPNCRISCVLYGRPTECGQHDCSSSSRRTRLTRCDDPKIRWNQISCLFKTPRVCLSIVSVLKKSHDSYLANQLKVAIGGFILLGLVRERRFLGSGTDKSQLWRFWKSFLYHEFYGKIFSESLWIPLNLRMFGGIFDRRDESAILSVGAILWDRRRSNWICFSCFCASVIAASRRNPSEFWLFRTRYIKESLVYQYFLRETVVPWGTAWLPAINGQ
jgi:hypothetical protein